jgi:exosortase
MANIGSSTADLHRAIPPARSWRQLGLHNYIKIFIIAALFCYLFRHQVRTIVSRWVTDPNWSHGFLIPLFSFYFINQRKNQILAQRFKPDYLGLVFLICAILFYPFNIAFLRYGYLSPIAMIAALGAVVLFLGGWPLASHMWLPVGFLAFAVPLPQRYYVQLTMPMRHLAAKVAGVLLDLVNGLETSVTGVIIDVVYKGRQLEPALNVAEACSGMRLLMAFLALGVAMAYLHYRPAWQRVILLASTIPIAVLCNIVRVTATGFIYVLIHPKYAQGVYHNMLGLAMLPLAFALYGLLAGFMSTLFVEEAQLEKDIVVRSKAPEA